MRCSSSILCSALLLASCTEPGPEGLARAPDARTTVKMDFFHRPLPEIPLPNDLATRFDKTSATGRRINASMIAPTELESRVRRLADTLDGWGLFQTITVPFNGPLEVQSILDGHRDANYDTSNDVIYLINVDKKSPRFGKIEHLDLGNGNYPVVLENMNYWENDPRGWTLSLAFEEENEDLNGNGELDPGEDTDADGQLDFPNYLPGATPARDDLAARADALMTFYENQSNTLIARPMVPLDERTTYAVVVTRRLKDVSGFPVGSPFEFINHTAQTEALKYLPEVLPEGVSLEDVAFAFSYTTQSLDADWIAIRDGLYGHGVQQHLGQDFPAVVDAFERLRDAEVFSDAANLKIIYTEHVLDILADVAVELVGIEPDTDQFDILLESQRYVDYHIVGSFLSPQLFERNDAEGKPLPWDEQSWPNDLHQKPANARAERVYFWLTVPRKEISVRGEGKPAPVVIAGHGYTSNRFEMLFYSGYFARQGLATIAIDCVSHGLEVHPLQQAAVLGMVQNAGVGPFVQSVFKDRAYDQDGDLVVDSGADFWTSYLFHTRDVVRQSAVDYMQLVRILRGFDGAQEWAHDLDGDGQPELAGDFDGDGEIDVGGDATIGITGGSLGGIMSMAIGALEPEVSVSVPIAGGGGLSDIGIRSRQGGVREAVQLRLMAPLFTGTRVANGDLELATIVPDLNSDARLVFGTVSGVEDGDTLVVENGNNGKLGCGYVRDGRVRAGVESDFLDAIAVKFYRGEALLGRGDAHCEVANNAVPYAVVDKFMSSVSFQAKDYRADSSLVALAEGLALPRAHPRLRRFLGLSQLVLDPADPAVLSRNLREPLKYANTEPRTAHTLIVTTMGDMNVPASSGVSVGRAAGYINYLENDPRYGKPANQVLLDTHTAEAVNTLKRYTNSAGEGIHLDVENFSQGTDRWGSDVPRLDPPLHLGLKETDLRGGISGAIFPYAVPEGQHGFAFPGEMTDEVKRDCRNACTDGSGCGCEDLKPFDIGFFMYNMLGRYFSTGGKELPIDLCNSSNTCSWSQSPPPLRDVVNLR
jgi:hypothetical protein